MNSPVKSSSIMPRDTDEFAVRAGEAVNFLKELANEKRLMILCALIDTREMTVAELTASVDLSQSALSQHLARLREQNLVSFRREGASLYYRIANANVGRIIKTLKSIFC
jgi:ArsR family transcriptional regulator, virulence genes transcriptional regulator